MDANDILFRASSNGKLFINARDKSEAMSATTKTWLNELHIEKTTGRTKEFDNKYIQKGLKEEENGLTLLSRTIKTMLTKNSVRLNNEFVTGEPDTFLGEEIVKALSGYDTKCSWSVFTMPTKNEKLDPIHKWQNVTYMALTGAKMWTTAYCLVNAPANLIDNEKKSSYYKMGCPSDNDPAYIKRCKKIEKNMIFDLGLFMIDNMGYNLHTDIDEWKNNGYDIPKENRCILRPVERVDSEIEMLYTKVKEARIWMNQNLFV